VFSDEIIVESAVELSYSSSESTAGMFRVDCLIFGYVSLCVVHLCVILFLVLTFNGEWISNLQLSAQLEQRAWSSQRIRHRQHH
jgi:hypothetical protein